MNSIQNYLYQVGLTTPVRRTVAFSLIAYGVMTVLKPSIAYDSSGRPKAFGPGFWPFDGNGSIITPTIVSVAIGGLAASMI